MPDALNVEPKVMSPGLEINAAIEFLEWFRPDGP